MPLSKWLLSAALLAVVAHVAVQEELKPLGRAARAGDLAALERHLLAGADVHRGVDIGPWGLTGTRTPLHLAVISGHVLVVEALVHAGAYPNRGVLLGLAGVLHRETPLARASASGKGDVVRVLLRTGASADDGKGFGPLGIVATWTPRGLALKRGHEKVALELQLAGGHVEPSFWTIHRTARLLVSWLFQPVARIVLGVAGLMVAVAAAVVLFVVVSVSVLLEVMYLYVESKLGIAGTATGVFLVMAFLLFTSRG